MGDEELEARLQEKQAELEVQQAAAPQAASEAVLQDQNSKLEEALLQAAQLQAELVALQVECAGPHMSQRSLSTASFTNSDAGYGSSSDSKDSTPDMSSPCISSPRTSCPRTSSQQPATDCYDSSNQQHSSSSSSSSSTVLVCGTPSRTSRPCSPAGAPDGTADVMITSDNQAMHGSATAGRVSDSAVTGMANEELRAHLTQNETELQAQQASDKAALDHMATELEAAQLQAVQFQAILAALQDTHAAGHTSDCFLNMSGSNNDAWASSIKTTNNTAPHSSKARISSHLPAADDYSSSNQQHTRSSRGSAVVVCGTPSRTSCPCSPVCVPETTSDVNDNEVMRGSAADSRESDTAASTCSSKEDSSCDCVMPGCAAYNEGAAVHVELADINEERFDMDSSTGAVFAADDAQDTSSSSSSLLPVTPDNMELERSQALDAFMIDDWQHGPQVFLAAALRSSGLEHITSRGLRSVQTFLSEVIEEHHWLTAEGREELVEAAASAAGHYVGQDAAGSVMEKIHALLNEPDTGLYWRSCSSALITSAAVVALGGPMIPAADMGGVLDSVDYELQACRPGQPDDRVALFATAEDLGRHLALWMD